MRPYVDFSDQQLIDEIHEYRGALKTLALGRIAVIAGEGRRVEYGPTQMKLVRNELRELGSEARRRKLPIGGDDNDGRAIAVEIGV